MRTKNNVAPTKLVTVGSYWADNKIWMFGRVVQAIAVTDTHATVVVTQDHHKAQLGVSKSQVGKQYRIKLDWFRPLDRPRHGGFLPAEGPHDGRTTVLTGEPSVAEMKGMPHARLLQLKYANGWTVRVAETKDVVDFEPRRTGDGRAWRDAAGNRYPATQCEAEFTTGIKMRFGQSIEDMGTNTQAHIMVDDRITSCGISVCEPCDQLDAHTMMCVKCEAENPVAVMQNRIKTRLSGWFGVTAADDTKNDVVFGALDLDQLLNGPP